MTGFISRFFSRCGGTWHAGRRGKAFSLFLFLFRSPDLLEPPVAAAADAVELVARRVSQVEVLVVILGRIELGCRDDFGHDGLFETALQGRLGFLREAFLCFLVVENGRPILIPEVAKLAVGRERVDIVPEDVEEFFVADFFRIVGHLHRFGVAGGAGDDFVVSRVLFRAAGEARDGRNDAVHLVEEQFHGPETAAGKNGLGSLRSLAVPLSRISYPCQGEKDYTQRLYQRRALHKSPSFFQYTLTALRTKQGPPARTGRPRQQGLSVPDQELPSRKAQRERWVGSG